MTRPTRKVVVVGGGTAGWLTANVVASEQRERTGDAVQVTLIEAPDVPAIGVGEGTWPSMRSTLQRIGLAEDELLRACDASFKQGTRFRGWSGEERQGAYCHPFSWPAEYASVNPAAHWLARNRPAPFAECVTPQARIIELGLAPKQPSAPHYAFTVNYGYHLNAIKFAEVLRGHATNTLGVAHMQGTVQGASTHPDGDIAAVKLNNGQLVEGDLFVDCTGLRALLLGGHFERGLVSARRTLFNDAAIAAQVPYANPEADPIASATLATAQADGWIWDIGLGSRRGVGYVFSQAHTDEETATLALHRYISATSPAVDAGALTFRAIRFEPGHRSEFWVRNCVAVGLSAGFVEPLEASALALVEQAAAIIGRQLPRDRRIMDVVAKRFNAKMRHHWERIIEFLKLHYVAGGRNDTRYWRDHQSPDTCPAGLCEKLTLWQQQPPWHEDAPLLDELFPSASYQYVLYGLGFTPRYPMPSDGRTRERAEQAFRQTHERAQELARRLPTTRGLVNALARPAAQGPMAQG